MFCEACKGNGSLCECDGVIGCGANENDPNIAVCRCTVPEIVDCVDCDGLGFTSVDCTRCEGLGDIETDDGEIDYCPDCDGSGEK